MPATILTYSVTSTGTTRTIHLSGEMDMSNARDVWTWIRNVIDAKNVTTIHVDLALLTSIDSTGIRCLINCHVHAHRNGANLTVVNPTVDTRALLQTAGVAELLGVK